MNGLLSIKTADSHSIKDYVKICIGRGLSRLLPARTAELQAAPTNHAGGAADRFLMAHLKNRARIQHDAAFFESLHREFWTGEGGEVFSANCDHRFEDIFLDRQREEFEHLKRLWRDGAYARIIEIGCSSGRLLQFLTTQLPGLSHAIGIDLNQAQIQRNRESNRFDSRVEFRCDDGLDYVLAHATPGTLVVTNGGVLEYFSRGQLDQLLGHLAENVGHCLFFAIEPIAPDHDWSATRESIPFGEELSFSHNYRDAFVANGFCIEHQRYVDFESWRWMATLAKTAGSGFGSPIATSQHAPKR